MKAKLSACLTTETAKQTIIDLRNEFDLTEKELMDLVLKQALRRKSELTKLVETFHTDKTAEREANKEARMAQYKAKAAQKRKEKSLQKLEAKLQKLNGTSTEVVIEVPAEDAE